MLPKRLNKLNPCFNTALENSQNTKLYWRRRQLYEEKHQIVYYSGRLSKEVHSVNKRKWRLSFQQTFQCLQSFFNFVNENIATRVKKKLRDSIPKHSFAVLFGQKFPSGESLEEPLIGDNNKSNFPSNHWQEFQSV